MSALQPGIGAWYRMRGGDTFEVVAVDEAGGTVEVQHFDGTVEEFELDDWLSQYADGTLVSTEAPEDWSGSVDVEDGDDEEPSSGNSVDGSLNAAGVDSLDGLDLFE